MIANENPVTEGAINRFGVSGRCTFIGCTAGMGIAALSAVYYVAMMVFDTMAVAASLGERPSARQRLQMDAIRTWNNVYYLVGFPLAAMATALKVQDAAYVTGILAAPVIPIPFSYQVTEYLKSWVW